MVKKISLFYAIIITNFFVTKLSFAHHFIDGQTPKTLFEGFISGIAHPVLGFDHLIFLIFISLIIFLIFKKFFFICFFIILTIIGSFFSILNLSLPILELSIIISIFILGFYFFFYKYIPNLIFIFSFILFGFIHGSGYGKSIIESLISVQLSYIIGFTLVQFIVCLISFYLGKFLINTNTKEQYSPYLISSLNIIAAFVMLYIYI